MTAALYRNAMHSVGVPILIFDGYGTIIWCNREFTIGTGYQCTDLVHKNISELIEFGSASPAALQGAPGRSPLALPDGPAAPATVRRADRSTFTAQAVVRAMESDDATPFFVCVLHDATTSERSLQWERERSRTDELTGAYCRSFLVESLRQAIAATRDTGLVVAVLFIDLDGFKEVNDVHGHGAGDDLLRAVTARLRSGTRASDMVGRYGGDEFVVMLPALASRQLAYDLGRHLVNQLAQPFSLGRVTLRIGASIGVAFFPDHGNDVRTIMMRADEAMYRGKRGGGGTVAIAQSLCSLVSRRARSTPVQIACFGAQA